MATNARILACAGAIEALQDALDDRLRPIDRSAWLAAHLADCPRCRGRAGGLEVVDRAGRHLAAEILERRAAARGRAMRTWCAAATVIYLLAGPAIVARVTGTPEQDRRARQGDAVERVLEELSARRAIFFRGGNVDQH